MCFVVILDPESSVPESRPLSSAAPSRVSDGADVDDGARADLHVPVLLSDSRCKEVTVSGLRHLSTHSEVAMGVFFPLFQVRPQNLSGGCPGVVRPAPCLRAATASGPDGPGAAPVRGKVPNGGRPLESNFGRSAGDLRGAGHPTGDHPVERSDGAAPTR